MNSRLARILKAAASYVAWIKAGYLFTEFLTMILLLIIVLKIFVEMLPIVIFGSSDFQLELNYILTMFVFIDLLRLVSHNLIEKRFRLDILLEALIIAVGRELIGLLAISHESSAKSVILLTGVLSLLIILWIQTKKTELVYRKAEKPDV
jgi:uncharacterized membrane protein (DUF373 family)